MALAPRPFILVPPVLVASRGGLARAPSRVGRWLAVVAAALVLALSPAASAQSEADVATARELAKEAFQAYDGGDHARAEGLFERASKLYPAPTLLLGLARTRVKLGKLVEARENYLRIVRSQLPSDASEAFREAQEAARREVREVEPRVAWVTVTLEGAEPADLTISVGEHTLPAEALGARRPVDPGRHVVRAVGNGFEPFEATFEVGEGGSEDVVVRPRRRAAPEPLQIAAPAGDVEAQGGGSVVPLVGYALLGVGGAGILVGAITGGIAVSQHGELRDRCVGGRCEPTEYDTLDGFRTMSTVSTAGVLVGVVVAAAGLTMVVFDAVAGESTTAVRVAPGAVSLISTF